MIDHDKKCEVILWKNNLWNASWCHERALEDDNERLRGLLARIDNCDAIEINRDYSEEAVAIAEVIWDDIHAVLAGQTERQT